MAATTIIRRSMTSNAAAATMTAATGSTTAAAAATDAAAASSEMFRKSWSLYQKMIQSNGLSHREAYSSLHCAIKQYMDHRPFHFVDLACGDASYSTWALQDTKVQQYTGVDLSETALSFARQSIQEKLVDHPDSNVQKADLLVGDFCNFETILKQQKMPTSHNDNPPPPPLDVVWVGLSLHHLETKEKASFMTSIAKNLTPSDGLFIIYEPICLPGQTQVDYYDRFQTVGKRLYSGILDRTELDMLFEHVTQQDIPESHDNWLALGEEAGFPHGEVLFNDQHGLCSAFCFHVGGGM